MRYQQTLKRKVTFMGVALHSGKPVCMTLYPASEDTGIVFRRSMVGRTVEIPANIDCVAATNLATELSDPEGNSVRTTEHLLAAFTGTGIDNCVVVVSEDELPILDGCSKVFVDTIQASGIQVQDARRHMIRINRPLEIASGESWLRIEPWGNLSIDLTIDFKSIYFRDGPQNLALDRVYSCFNRELAVARTFAFSTELPKLRAQGKALGGSLENAIVIDGCNILNKGGLRYSDELVRHKMLDLVGDMYLLGYRLLGKITGYKTGHWLNCGLARIIADNKQSWDFVCSSNRWLGEDCLGNHVAWCG